MPDQNKRTVNLSGKGRMMFDFKSGDQHRSVLCRVNARMFVCCAVMWGVTLPWNSYANAEEVGTVHVGEAANVSVHADSQPLTVQDLDASAVVEANNKASNPVDTDPDLSVVVPLDASKGEQNSRLDLSASRNMQSLDVIDTGSAVTFPQAVDDIGEGIDHQKVTVDLGDQVLTPSNEILDQGGQLEAVSNHIDEQDDQSLVTGTSVNLPVTNTVDVQGRVGEAEGQLKDVSSEAANEENAGLPYAFVLALLALIGLVPVARRNDHYRV